VQPRHLPYYGGTVLLTTSTDRHNTVPLVQKPGIHHSVSLCSVLLHGSWWLNIWSLCASDGDGGGKAYGNYYTSHRLSLIMIKYYLSGYLLARKKKLPLPMVSLQQSFH